MIGLIFLLIGAAMIFFAVRSLHRRPKAEPQVEITMTLRGPDGEVIEAEE